MKPNNALVIGNSDGMGLGITKALLEKNWSITGISRSASPVVHENDTHHTSEVQNPDYERGLKSVLKNLQPLDLCIYCPGIGELLNVSNMAQDIEIFNVNLMGLVKTISYIIPKMKDQGHGHFMGLSSVADDMLSAEAPAYHASKAGFSSYLESLGLALKPQNIHVTNVRFGFVNTKMAKGDVKPFMMSVDRAVQHLLKCMHKRPIRYTAPKIVIPLVNFRRRMLKIQTLK